MEICIRKIATRQHFVSRTQAVMILALHTAVAVLALSVSTLYADDDISAFFFPDELEQLARESDTLWCWVNPDITQGRGQEETTGVSIPMADVMDRLRASAYTTVDTETFRTTLRNKLYSGMTIAFDNLFFNWLNDMSRHESVTDAFMCHLFPLPVDLHQMLCVEYFALDRRYDVLVPFNTDIGEWLNRRYTTDDLQAHFGLPFIMPSPDIVQTYTDKSIFGDWMVRSRRFLSKHIVM